MNSCGSDRRENRSCWLLPERRTWLVGEAEGRHSQSMRGDAAECRGVRVVDAWRCFRRIGWGTRIRNLPLTSRRPKKVSVARWLPVHARTQVLIGGFSRRYLASGLPDLYHSVQASNLTSNAIVYATGCKSAAAKRDCIHHLIGDVDRAMRELLRTKLSLAVQFRKWTRLPVSDILRSR